MRHEDEELLAIDKPNGMPAIPGGPPGESLRERVAAVVGPLYVAHRLDKDVRGVMLFARRAAVHRALNRKFSERLVEKTHLAVAVGDVASDRGRIDRHLRESAPGRMAVDRRGKPSTTLYEVRERLAGHTLLLGPSVKRAPAPNPGGPIRPWPPRRRRPTLRGAPCSGAIPPADAEHVRGRIDSPRPRRVAGTLARPDIVLSCAGEARAAAGPAAPA